MSHQHPANNPQTAKGQKPATQKPTDDIEGEGSYTATHNYDAGVEKSVERGDYEKLGQEAAKALDGPEGKDLKAAEQAGKQGPKHLANQKDQPQKNGPSNKPNEKVDQKGSIDRKGNKDRH